jgi:alanine racemase
MTRPLQARIHLPALTHNLGVVRHHAPNARTMAVIKANGYGHGMLRVASALKETDGFAVLGLNEALALRQAGFSQRVLLLEGFFDSRELPEIARHGLSTVIHCEEQLAMLREASLPAKVDVFLKFNTGMNRLGFKGGAFSGALEALRACSSVNSVTLMTHFATADEAAGIDRQLAMFSEATAGMALPRSLANSAAILRFPESHADWVRPGIMLYGVSPFADQAAAALNLKPAMTLESRVIAVQTLEPGEIVGYGALFRAERRTRVGVVACGYADGYPRHAPTGTPVAVDGRSTRTVGRVSMDMLFVDLTDLPNAGVGSPVTLWGEGVPVEEVAQAAGTIGYELLCAVAARVPVMED